MTSDCVTPQSRLPTSRKDKVVTVAARASTRCYAIHFTAPRMENSNSSSSSWWNTLNQVISEVSTATSEAWTEIASIVAPVESVSSANNDSEVGFISCLQRERVGSCDGASNAARNTLSSCPSPLLHSAV